ncbi:hypothetical protein BOFL111202_21585 [Bordetella flabilis]
MRCVRHQESACLGSRLAQRRCRDLDRGAGDGGSLVGRGVGVPEDHAYPVHGDVQFFRDDLRQGGANPRAQIDMAVQRQDTAIVQDGDEYVGPGCNVVGRGSRLAGCRPGSGAGRPGHQKRTCAVQQLTRRHRAALVIRGGAEARWLDGHGVSFALPGKRGDGRIRVTGIGPRLAPSPRESGAFKIMVYTLQMVGRPRRARPAGILPAYHCINGALHSLGFTHPPPCG